MYARLGFNCVVHVSDSPDAERTCYFLHADCGIILVGNMYRPPDATPIVIESLWDEFGPFFDKVAGVVLLGDLNIHHKNGCVSVMPTLPQVRSFRNSGILLIGWFNATRYGTYAW